MKLVIGLIIGAIIGALIGYLVWGRQVADLQARVAQLEAKLSSAPAPAARGAAGAAAGNPHSAVIVLQGAQGEECKAKVDPYRIGNKRNNKVYWDVYFDESQCQNGNGNWRVELRFGAGSGGNGWSYGPINVKRQGITPFTIPADAPYDTFPYEVWMIGTRSYQMADPELQIEQ